MNTNFMEMSVAFYCILYVFRLGSFTRCGSHSRDCFQRSQHGRKGKYLRWHEGSGRILPCLTVPQGPMRPGNGGLRWNIVRRHFKSYGRKAFSQGEYYLVCRSMGSNGHMRATIFDPSHQKFHDRRPYTFIMSDYDKLKNFMANFEVDSARLTASQSSRTAAIWRTTHDIRQGSLLLSPHQAIPQFSGTINGLSVPTINLSNSILGTTFRNNCSLFAFDMIPVSPK